MKLFAGILFMVAVVFAQPFAVASDEAKKQGGYTLDKNPPEVEALVGKRYFKTALPGWAGLGGNLLGISPQPGQEMGVEQFMKNGTFIFVIDLIYPDMNRVVLDAQVLPRQARLNKKEMLVKSKENSQLYRFTGTCKSEDEEKVVGMVRPLPEDENFPEPTWSTLVQRAWKINKQTGRITGISPEGISCIW